jgi:hypothetical protein
MKKVSSTPSKIKKKYDSISNSELKFYPFRQNNSGGYYVIDEENGISEFISIQAKDYKDSVRILQEISEKNDEFFDYCPCCGERWDTCNFDFDGDLEPMYYDEKLYDNYKGDCQRTAYVHYYDGKVVQFTYKY